MRMWLQRLLVTSLIVGLWLSILTPINSIAKPVKVSEIKINEQEISTFLMSDKLLGPFLLVNLIQIIVFLARWVWSSEKKKLERIEAAVNLIPNLVNKVEKIEEHLKQVPTHDQVELKIYRANREGHT